MAKIGCGSLIRRAGGPKILGTAGCLVQWPEEPDRVLLLTAGRVLVGRTPELFEAVEAIEAIGQPGKPIGCLYAWSDLSGPGATADVALVHVDPGLVDAGIGPSGAPTGTTNHEPKPRDKLTIFSNGKTHNLTITDFGDQTTIDRVTPDSQAAFTYLNQIICDPATEDSRVGAMAMDDSNNIVGMVVGGDGRTFTLVTPIDALLSCTFGDLHVGGSPLQVCTLVPATAKAPEKITHPDHATQTVEPGDSQRQQEDADFEKLIVLREGQKNVVYRDSLGKPTVGIGHLVVPDDALNVGDRITDEQVDAFFKKDSATAMGAARSQAAEAGITDSAFIPYLASVNFQLGTGWTRNFPRTWKLIIEGKYQEAADQAAESIWAKQTPVRLRDFQDALRKLPPKL
jgi:GH24 family phage-related lysozyme (muramidase)